MKYLLPVLLFLCIAEAHSNPTSGLSNLKPLEWQNRIIIANAVEHPQELVKKFADSAYEMNDRVIIWFIIQEQQVLTNYAGHIADDFMDNIHKRYQLNPREIVLIGKDGGVKSSQNTLDLKAFFSEIDAMPMRIQEMRD